MTDDTTITTDDDSMTLERVFKTTPDRLFAAWTDPALVSQWLAPGPMRVAAPVYEARKGGKWRLEMAGPGPDGKEMKMAYEGTFEEVTPGKRIVMNWPPALPDPTAAADAPPSVVTVTFEAVAGGTLMRLTQNGMPNKEGAGHGAQGWAMAFEKLAKLG